MSQLGDTVLSIPEGNLDPVDNPQDESRQVGHLGQSVFSVACPGSVGSKRRSSKSLELMRARVSQLTKECELLKLQCELKEAELAEECEEVDFENEENLSVKKAEDHIRTDRQTVKLYDEPTSVVNTSTPLCVSKPDLPKVELEYFDGSACSYWRFMQQFKYYIEDRVGDDGQRLLYLLHYCRGAAKKAIEECVILPPSNGYARAKEILRDLFGREHVVAKALLDDLFKRLKSTHEDAVSLSNLSIKMQNCQIALSQMGYTSDMDSVTTLEIIVKTLSQDARRRWARWADDMFNINHQATFFDLSQFVASEARIARSRFGQLVCSEVQSPVRPPKHLAERQPVLRTTFSTQFSMEKCPICHGEHELSECSSFSALDVHSRWEFVTKRKICYLCLCRGHLVRECKSEQGCEDGCDKRHHKLLHEDRKGRINGNCNTSTHAVNSVCLGVVPVRLIGPNGSRCTYALLDAASDVTLVEQGLMAELGLSGKDFALKLTTVNGCTEVSGTKMDITITSLDGCKSIVAKDAYCVPSLAVKSAVDDINGITSKWPHLSTISFKEIPDKRVRLLIGADVPEVHWPVRKKLGRPNEPFAVKTPLGWIVLGPLSAGRNSWREVHHIQESDITSQWEALYDCEFKDLEAQSETYSVEDKRAISVVENSVTFSEGHYEIALPWKILSKLPDNYKMAYHRLRGLQKRLNKDQSLLFRYKEEMEQNIHKGYLKPVPANQLRSEYYPRWYIPHHPVINPKKPEKLRVVLDCAAKFDGVSLNDCLYQGPDTTANLVGVLLRFRTDYVAVAADITEMFMQVKVPEVDRGALRILWWDSGDFSKRPVEFQMTSHPFGATSSPFCANFALRRTIQDWGTECMLEVKHAVDQSFYVDDCLISLPDEDTAEKFVCQLSQTLLKGGFHMRKWISNKPSVLRNIPESDISPSVVSIESAIPTVERTLGLEWDANSDVFRFKYVASEQPVTKRGILSAVSSLFDPLGYMSPLLLSAKLLLQGLCRRKVRWDEKLSDAEQCEWAKWLKSMESLGEARIPRCAKPLGCNSTQPELHVFSDASEVGYGIVVYERWPVGDNQHECRILYAKSRVAPLKAVSLPRLELNAARLAARVAADIKRELRAYHWTVNYWTDSMIVLHYIRNVSTRFSTFVANRISAIRELSLPSQWCYVAGTNNPADLTSRGTLSMASLYSWWRGPKFLESDSECWPIEPCASEELTNVELKRKNVYVNNTYACETENPNGLSRLVQKSSDWFKLLRSLVWLTRFKTYLRLMKFPDVNITMQTGRVKRLEICHAELDLIRMTQREVYPNVIRILEKKGFLSSSDMRKNSLAKLSPILIDGMICVGGRMENASWPHVSKHPVILPGRHHVALLLIRNIHEENGHSGVTHTLALLRERFWVVHGTIAVKRLVRNCWTCRKNMATVCQQIMAPLPVDRVQEGWHPFDIVGVDYFGPLLVRNGRKSEKRYGCLFTCLQTRAVHIEMAYSMSTDSFIKIIMKFIARRGAPSKFISDNGSNFVGAESELRQIAENASDDSVDKVLIKRGVEWQFHPPFSSHRGGVWERLIRSVKRILRSIANEQVLTDEKLSTLLIEAERILNSRPIVPWSQSDTERPALTPNDLLMLNKRVSGVVPLTMTERYIKGWQQVNYLTQVFWKRWTREYLPLLQTRQIWFNRSQNLNPGDVVLICSNSLPRERWPIGVVEACEVADDNMVRGVSVRTRDGVVRRDIRKICLIEGYDINLPTDPQRMVESPGIQVTGDRALLPSVENATGRVSAASL